MTPFKTYLIICLLITQNSFCQEQKQEAQIVHKGIPNIELTEPIDLNSTSNMFSKSFLFQVDNHLISISLDGGTWIKRLDSRLINSENGVLLDTLILEFDHKDIYIEDIMKINDVVYAFYSEYDEINNQETYNVFLITLVNEHFVLEDRKNLITVNGKILPHSNYNPGKIIHSINGKFQIKKNESFNKLVVYFSNYRSLEDKTKSINRIGYVIFDLELNKINEIICEVPQSYESTIDFDIDKNNNALAIMTNSSANNASKTNKLELVEFTSDGLYTNQEIKVDGVVDIKLAYNIDKILFLVGYFNLDHKKPIKGVFSLSYVGEILTEVNYNEFTFNLAIQYNKLSKLKKRKLEESFNNNEYGIFNLFIHSTIALKDGSILIIGTRTGSSSNSTLGRPTMANPSANISSPGTYVTGTNGLQGTAGGGSSTMYKEIMITNLSSKDQKILWNSKIPRYIYSNFLFIGSNENHAYFVFPDSKNNSSINDNSKVSIDESLFSESICVYQLNLNNGEKNRFQLTEKGRINKKNIGSTDQIVLNRNNQIIIELDYKKDNFGYLKVNF